MIGGAAVRSRRLFRNQRCLGRGIVSGPFAKYISLKINEFKLYVEVVCMGLFSIFVSLFLITGIFR